MKGDTRIAPLCALIVLSGCAGPQRPGHALKLPTEPSERLPTRRFYPARPPWINFKQIHDFITRSPEQITLLFVVGPDATPRRADLTAVDEAARRFYRYGVIGLMIDLNPDTNWPDLRRELHAINATFPAAYFDARDRDTLRAFLRRRDWPDRKLFLIDPAESRLRAVEFNNVFELLRDLRAYLQKRASGAGHVRD